MTQKGFDVLKFLVVNNYQSLISTVIGSKDDNLQNDWYKEIKEFCSLNSIVFADKAEKRIKTAPFSIAISWRWIIQDAPNLIVLHDSLLPKYRGFAPLVNSLKNGENLIGVTALFASSEYDRGDIIFQSAQNIEYPITVKNAIEKISESYIEVCKNIFEKISKGEPLNVEKQDDALATYSLWLDEDDYKVDWNQSSVYIKRFIDATGYPYSGAFTICDGIKFRILDAAVTDDVKIENRTAGKLIFMDKMFPVIVCGKGLLKITKIVYDSDGSSALPMRKFRTKFL